MRSWNRTLGAGVVGVFGIAGVSRADTTINLTADRDNTLYQSDDVPENQASNGGGQFLFAGLTNQPLLRRALLHFNVSTIPANAVITGATLTLRCSKTTSGALPADLHRVLTNWGEGTSDAGTNEGMGAIPTANDATWYFTFFGAATLWTTPGGDFAPAVSATQSVAGPGFYSWTAPALVADVQAWASGAASNFGWILIGTEAGPGSSKRYDSRQGLAANAPKLVVTYTVPAITGACCNGTTCAVGPQAGCGGVYKGDNSVCGPVGNPTTCCKANFNGAGGVTVQDLFDFLAAWFAKLPSADFNGNPQTSAGVTVQDLFDFLAAWFAKCPG